MITSLIILICMIIFKVPSDWIRNMSSDTAIILFCLYVISDLHIFLWCLRGKADMRKEQT